MVVLYHILTNVNYFSKYVRNTNNNMESEPCAYSIIFMSEMFYYTDPKSKISKLLLIYFGKYK